MIISFIFNLIRDDYEESGIGEQRLMIVVKWHAKIIFLFADIYF